MSQAVTKILLGGYPVLASSDVRWKLTSGVRPHIGTFDMTPLDAMAVISQPSLDLHIGDDIKVENLFPLGYAPSENPRIRKVRVADRRVWWSYKFINRMYNKRRNVGFKRMTDPTSAAELQPVVPKVWYRRWTLKNQNPDVDPSNAKWSATEVIEDILKELQKPEKDAFGSTFPFTVFGQGPNLSTLDVEDLQLKDNGDVALSRVLSFLPGTDVYVQYDGRVIVYSKNDIAREEFMIDELGPRVVAEGDYRFVSNELLRPKKVNVYFQYMPEIRFDADETPGVTRTIDERFSENVLPVPDYQLALKDSSGNNVTDANGSSIILAQGTWITIEEAFNSWGIPPGFNNTTKLTHDLVQKAMVPYMSIFPGLQLAGAFQPDADWGARIASLQANYRRTYRINRQWVDRVHKILGFRTSLVNPTTGTRAPATAYSDFSYLTGERALFNESKGGVGPKSMSYCINIKGHPAIGNQPASKNISSAPNLAHSVPGAVKIVDADQGILRVNYILDPYRMFENILPSMVTLANKENDIDAFGRPNFAGPASTILQHSQNGGANGNIINGIADTNARPVCWGALGKAHLDALPKLTKNHKMSMIFTAIPGAPNSNASLFRIPIEPSQVESNLPSLGIEPADLTSLGPEMDVYIGAKTECARIAWDDDYATTIQEIFLNTDGKDQSDKVKDLVLNYSKTTTAGASLSEIALGAATRVYASLIDRYVGTKTGTLTKDITPAGWISDVELSVSPKGEAFTSMTMPTAIAPIDLFSFLDSDTRAVILGLATPDDVS